MSDEIKPRVDEDGVAWCDAGCPQAKYTGEWSQECLLQPGKHYRPVLRKSACPVAARRNAALLRECRKVLIRVGNVGLSYDNNREKVVGRLEEDIDALLERIGE